MPFDSFVFLITVSNDSEFVSPKNPVVLLSSLFAKSILRLGLTSIKVKESKLTE